MLNTSVAFAAYLPIRVSPQSAPLGCFLKRKPCHGSQQHIASLRLAGALCKRLYGSRTPIASGKVVGDDDRFGVLAYEGVGLGHFAACAVRPFDTSGQTGWVFGGRWPSIHQGERAGVGAALRQAQCERGGAQCERGGGVWHWPFDTSGRTGFWVVRTGRGCSLQPQSFTGPSTEAPDATTALACCWRTRSTY
jgi:hypothetical protein